MNVHEPKIKPQIHRRRIRPSEKQQMTLDLKRKLHKDHMDSALLQIASGDLGDDKEFNQLIADIQTMPKDDASAAVEVRSMAMLENMADESASRIVIGFTKQYTREQFAHFARVLKPGGRIEFAQGAK